MLNILIVEDEAAIRLLTKTKLRNEYNIIEAANGVQALEVLEHKHIDLIIADIMMPEMNGYEFVQSLRDSGDMTPVIMLTAMSTFAHKKKGSATGIDDYMVKPIDYEELKWRIEALLRRAQIANEKRIVVGALTLHRFLFSVSLKQSANGLSEALGSLKSKIDLASNAVKVETSQEQTNKAKGRESTKKSSLSLAYEKLNTLISDIGSVDLKVSKKLKNVKMIFIVNIVI